MTGDLKLTGSDNMINKRKKYSNFYVESCNLAEDTLLFSFPSLKCQVYLPVYSF